MWILNTAQSKKYRLRQHKNRKPAEEQKKKEKKQP